MKTLFIVKGERDNEVWTVYVIAESPGAAVDAATRRKAWNVLSPLVVEMPLEFFDATKAEKDEAPPALNE